MINPTRCFLLLLALTFIASVARAAGPDSLDQSYVVDQSGGYRSYILVAGVRDAQTFRVGTSGLLSQVDVQVDAWSGYPPNPDLLTSPLFLTINTVLPGGAPSATILASVAIPPDQVPRYSPPNLVSVDLTAANIQVTAGQNLAIVLSCNLPAPPTGQPPEANYGWLSLGENGYADGSGWYSYQANQWLRQEYDFGFQTYVVPVPEPSSLVLLGLGSVATLICRRRH